MEAKVSFGIGMLIILAVIFPTGLLCYHRWLELEAAINSGVINLTQTTNPEELTAAQEKKRIDTWILKNNLNEFGDPKGTAYTGGTPLFNETTGKNIDKYQYIIQNHPDKPWNK